MIIQAAHTNVVESLRGFHGDGAVGHRGQCTKAHDLSVSYRPSPVCCANLPYSVAIQPGTSQNRKHLPLESQSAALNPETLQQRAARLVAGHIQENPLLPTNATKQKMSCPSDGVLFLECSTIILLAAVFVGDLRLEISLDFVDGHPAVCGTGGTGGNPRLPP